MNELVGKYMERAQFALEASDSMLEDAQLFALANRAYYAVFYCVCAVLATQDVYTKKHQAARAKFGELFINTNLFPKEASKILGRTFNARQSADYDMEADIGLDEANELLNGAHTFYVMTVDYFRRNAIL